MNVNFAIKNASETLPFANTFVLTEGWIIETLELYKREHIYITGASTKMNETMCQFMMQEYPFTNPGHIDYITASMANLLIAQAGYIHIRSQIEFMKNHNTDGISIDAFKKARDEGNIVITSLALKFKRKIQTHVQQEMVINNSHVIRRKNSILSNFTCNICDNSIFGDGIIAMILE